MGIKQLEEKTIRKNGCKPSTEVRKNRKRLSVLTPLSPLNKAPCCCYNCRFHSKTITVLFFLFLGVKHFVGHYRMALPVVALIVLWNVILQNKQSLQ